MLQPSNLDEREQLIYDSADMFWATRVQGRWGRTRLGPFSTTDEAVNGINNFFRAEEHANAIPQFSRDKPFMVYASSSMYGRSHVHVGNVYRDGVHRPTYKEVSIRRQEERKRVRRGRSSNAQGRLSV